MKKAFIILCAFTMIFSIVGCTTNETSSNETQYGNVQTESSESTSEYSYIITATGQGSAYDLDGNVIETSIGDELYGQDADYAKGAEQSFTDNGDGTVTDNATGLMWEQIPISETMSWDEAVEYCENLELAGYDDWRIPTAKELFNLSDFETGWPFLNTDYFEFAETSSQSGPPQDGEAQDGGPQDGAEAVLENESDQGEMPASPQDGENSDSEMPPPPSGDSEDGTIGKQQGQFWSANFYEVGTTHNGAPSAFGVNHATGHIKAYPSDVGGQMGKYVRAVRGEETAVNDFTDNGDGTVSDQATGLMWMQDDNGEGVEWADALAYAENSEFAGYDDWRLPNLKELQSIVDYSGVYPAIDDTFFNTTELSENINYYFWTSSSAYFGTNQPENAYAWYVAFGKAVGNDGEDSHGAGAVRFSPKYQESEFAGEGGDNIFNSVRLVRDID